MSAKLFTGRVWKVLNVPSSSGISVAGSCCDTVLFALVLFDLLGPVLQPGSKIEPVRL